ncbi:DUF4403 family protein [Hellea sp.]|nr:DUF4403 family protein [Hellea sp.]
MTAITANKEKGCKNLNRLEKTMKKLLISILLATLVISLLVFLIFRPGSTIKPMPPSPASTSLLDPISTQSEIFLPISISTKFIADTLEEHVPKSIIDVSHPSIDVIKDEKLTVKASRSKLTTSSNENGITVSTSLKTSARLFGRIKFGLGSKSGTTTPRGTINPSFTSKPEFKSDWKINPNLSYTFTIPEMKAKILGVSVSLRTKTREAESRALDKQKFSLNNNFPANQKFREEAEKLWKQAHIVSKIYDTPATWIVTKPQSFMVAQPVFDNTKMTLGVGIRVENSVITSDIEPKIDVSELPKVLEIVTLRKNENININLPFSLNYIDVNKSINSALTQKPIVINQEIAGEKITLKILAGEMIPNGSGLILKIKIRSKLGGVFGEKGSGELYLSAIPILDKSSNKIKFAEVSYHADTKSALANAAAYLLKPIILSQIQENLIVDLTELEAQAIEKAKVEINRMNNEIPQGLKLTLDPAAITLNDLIVSKEYLQLIFGVKGSVDISIDENFLFPVQKN